jgi:hypothetical protein
MGLGNTELSKANVAACTRSDECGLSAAAML